MAQGTDNAVRPEVGLQIGEVLSSQSSRYKIDKFLGKGSYGQVFQCTQLCSYEEIAVKIIEAHLAHAGRRELAILKELKKLDENKNNVVMLIDHFNHRGSLCLAFEKLDISLVDLMKQRSLKPLSLSEIRVISQQMLVTLNTLKAIHVIHADIKPDNIMLVNHELQPFKVKLIDFGLARAVSKMKSGTKVQAVGYRAPEVSLGLPLNEAIDMWGLGCVLALVYTGKHLYPVQSEYEAMRVMVQMQGRPNDHLLDSGIFTTDYFTKEDASSTIPWRLNTQEEFKKATGCVTKPYTGPSDTFTSLDDIIKTYEGERDPSEYGDTKAFLSLLRHMLQVDPRKRITPSEALRHQFVTEKQFPQDTKDNMYLESALSGIKDSQLEQLSEELKPIIISSKEVNLNGENRTCSDDPRSDNQSTVDTSNGPPVTDGSDHTTASGAGRTLHSTKKDTSFFSVSHYSNESNASSDKGAKGGKRVQNFKSVIKSVKQRLQ